MKTMTVELQTIRDYGCFAGLMITLLKQKPDLTRKQLAKELGISVSAVQKYITILEKDGVLTIEREVCRGGKPKQVGVVFNG